MCYARRCHVRVEAEAEAEAVGKKDHLVGVYCA